MGHATRCVPLARYLIDQGAEVIFIAGRGNEAYLKKEFPNCQVHVIEGYEPKYGRRNGLLHWIGQASDIKDSIEHEKMRFDGWLDKIEVDAIISDNRYGIFSEAIPSAIITHQLNLQVGLLSPLANKRISNYLTAFDHVWIPDVQGKEALSGKLSKTENKQTKFLGPLSRWAGYEGRMREKDYDVLAIVSGPENQRTYFEEKLNEVLEQTEMKAWIVCGQAHLDFDTTKGNLRMTSHLGGDDLVRAIQSSEQLICRAGYSSIMDMVAIGRRPLLIPTDGQPEQEYLASHASKNLGFESCLLKELSAERLVGHRESNVSAAYDFRGFQIVVDEFLSGL